MRNDPEAVVDGFYKALVLGDRPAMLAYFADDACFKQHVPADLIPHSGEICGKENLKARAAWVYEFWDIDAVSPSRPRLEGGLVHGSVAFAFRRKGTGDVYEGLLRHVFQVVDGRIKRLDEYLDSDMLRAFLEMTGQGRTA